VMELTDPQLREVFLGEADGVNEAAAGPAVRAENVRRGKTDLADGFADALEVGTLVVGVLFRAETAWWFHVAAAGLEPAVPVGARFTAGCNSRYATPPQAVEHVAEMLGCQRERWDLNRQPSASYAGALSGLSYVRSIWSCALEATRQPQAAAPERSLGGFPHRTTWTGVWLPCVFRTGIEPVFSEVKARRDNHYSNGTYWPDGNRTRSTPLVQGERVAGYTNGQ